MSTFNSCFPCTLTSPLGNAFHYFCYRTRKFRRKAKQDLRVGGGWCGVVCRACPYRLGGRLAGSGLAPQRVLLCLRFDDSMEKDQSSPTRLQPRDCKAMMTSLVHLEQLDSI